MAARQRIIPIRRQYNRWVADETLEDYALRFTAKSARRWSQQRVAQTAIGAISFLALEAIGGAITLSYGTVNAVAAIVAASLAMLVVGWPIARTAARHGVDRPGEKGDADQEGEYFGGKFHAEAVRRGPAVWPARARRIAMRASGQRDLDCLGGKPRHCD